MKKKQTIEQLKQEGLVKNASEITVDDTMLRIKERYKKGGTMEQFGEWDKTRTKWIYEIEDYCGELGILPIDLILCHKEARKPKKGTKTPKTEEIGSTEAGSAKNNRSNWFKDYKKAKTGISE